MNRAAFLALIALFALGACAQNHELAVAKGAIFALNPGRWSPSVQDLTVTNLRGNIVPTAAPMPSAMPAYAQGGAVELNR